MHVSYGPALLAMTGATYPPSSSRGGFATCAEDAERAVSSRVTTVAYRSLCMLYIVGVALVALSSPM